MLDNQEGLGEDNGKGMYLWTTLVEALHTL